MAPQAIALQRRDLEPLLLAAGNARALEQLAATDDQTALIVVVLADTDQEHAPAADLQAHPAVLESVDEPTAPPRRDALARRRREVCKTQEGLAAEVGVQRSTVARWESGDTTPSLWARPRIANALDISLNKLDKLLTTNQNGNDQSQTGAGHAIASATTPPPVAVVQRDRTFSSER